MSRARAADAPIIETRQVARLLGLSVLAFRDKRDWMIETQGFPQPMPYATSPLLWRRDQVEAWLARQGLPVAEDPPPRPSGPNIVLLEKARHA